MNQAGNIIHVPIWAVTGTTLLFCLAVGGLFGRALCRQNNKTDRAAPPDWSIPTIDAYAETKSLFHSWDPRIKITVLLCFCFLITSLQYLIACLMALFIAGVAVYFCHLPWKRVQRRLMAISGFLAMFLIIMPFTSPAKEQETILLFPLLSAFPFHLHGLTTAVKLSLKACSIALLMEPMFATAPLAVTLQAGYRIGLPPAMGEMILLTHRYIFLFLQEGLRMYRAMKVRGFNAGNNTATMRTMGNFFGMLFIRSYDRTQQVYDAMLSRGYTGTLPTYVHFKVTLPDIGKGCFWLFLGLFLLGIDHIATL